MSDSPTAGWKAFFDSHAPHYLKNVFAQNTVAEVDFLLERMKLPAGSAILDVGCGVGRHSVELAKRGFAMTGVDLSEGMLAEARKLASEIGVEVEWIQADATEFESGKVYDAAICLCEGGFGLAGLDEEPVGHDLAILRNIYAALKPGAPFVLTALNGYSIIRRMTDQNVLDGIFDPSTMIAQYMDEMELPEGKRQLAIRERLLIAPELVAMLRHVGFEVQHVWGGTAGDWGERPIKLDEIEAMYWCSKGP